MSNLLTVGPDPAPKYIEWESVYESAVLFTLTGLKDCKIRRIEVQPLYAGGKFVTCQIKVVYLLTQEQAKTRNIAFQCPPSSPTCDFQWSFDTSPRHEMGEITVPPQYLAQIHKRQLAKFLPLDPDAPLIVGE